MKGRPPKPAALRAIDGGASRRRDDGMQELDLPAGTPEPPAFLSAGAKQEFFRIVKFLCQRPGLLSPVDCAGLGTYCSYYDQWQQAERDLPRLRQRTEELEDALATKLSARERRATEKAYGRALNALNKALGERNKARREIRAYLGEFGLTPGARARIRVPNGQQELPLGESDPLASARSSLAGA